MSTMNRIVVVGSSASGKTTFARRLAAHLGVPHLEMDAVFHRHGLAHVAHQDFLPVLDEFTDQDRWIIDGNYTSHGTRDVPGEASSCFSMLQGRYTGPGALGSGRRH
jgi:hypothetical protein